MSDLNSKWPWGLLDTTETILQLPDGKIASMRRVGDLLSSQLLDSSEDRDSSTEEFTIISEKEELFYVPILPDRSVVLRSEHVLRIVPQNQFSTMVPIPLVPTISRKNRKKNYEPIINMPITSLSKTWFGDPVSGEPALAMSGMLNEAVVDEDIRPWVAFCPLVISNTSPEILSFERLILRVPLLSLYLGNHRYYTNQLTVHFRGQEQSSRVQIGSSAPDIEENLALFAEAKTKKDNLLFRKSFSFIKSLAYD